MLRRKSKSKRKPRLLKKTDLITSFIDISDIGENYLTFKRKTNKYITILKISGIDIFNYNDDDQGSIFNSFGKATKSLTLPYKYVFTNARPDLSKQKDFINYKLEKVNHSFCKELLERQFNYFDFIENNQRDRLAYLIIFGDDIPQLIQSAERYKAIMVDTAVEIISGKEQISILHNIMQFKDSNYEGETLNEQILPERIKIKQQYLEIDNIFVTDIVVYDYPVYLLDLQFAALFSKFDTSNTTITLDCLATKKDDILPSLNSSMQELKARRSLNQTDGEQIESESDLSDLRAIYESVARNNEQMLNTTLRFYITDENATELGKTVSYILEELKSLGISGFVPENLMLNEYMSLTMPSNNIQNAIPVEDTFKFQFPFYYQTHIDPCGTWHGETATKGQVIFNSFRQTQDRISYDILLAGIKGSGKSATLKAMIADQVMLGNKVMTFDLEGEYGNLVRKVGGKIVKLTKSSTINPLQLRQSIVAAQDKDEIESNFVSELSRIETFISQYIPDITDIEMEAFKDILLDTYTSFGIHEQTDISRLQPDKFPIMSDLLYNIRNYMKSDISENKFKIYERLEMYIKPIAEGTYSSMFNGYTNINIESDNLIVFDVKALSELEDKIFNAQLSNILAIMWGEICNNVEINKKLKNPYDRHYVVAVIDEAHKYINNDVVLKYIIKLLRRSRKYDSALWFASQSISDYNIDMSILFALVQYKMLLKQTAESVPTLKKLFPQFTDSELMSLENFVPGEMLLSLGGGRQKIHCRRLIPDDDFRWIGNSRDEERLNMEVYSNA